MEKETMGTVISVTKQWWLKVNRKRFVCFNSNARLK